MITGWQAAVMQAIWLLGGGDGRPVTRQRLLEVLLPAFEGGSCREPAQAVSLALQRLRDKGRIEFVGTGTYRVVAPTNATPGGWHHPANTEETIVATESVRKIETTGDLNVVSTSVVGVPPRARDLPPAPPKPPTAAGSDAPMPGDFGKMAFLPASLLVCDEYQRAKAVTWVERTAKVFDWKLLGVLIVNLRTTGEHYVIDGQHRTLLLKQTGRGEIPVPCYLFEGLTPDQEADIFIRSQKPGVRRSLNAVDIFWAEYFRGDEEAQGVQEAVTRAGGRIARSNQQLWEPGGTIRALAQLRRAWRTLGTDRLCDILTALRQAWGLGGLASSGVHIWGAALFWTHYGAQVDRRSLVEHLSKRTPQQMMADATAAATSLSSEGKAYGMALVILREYNKGRTAHRLPVTPLISASDKRARQGSAGSAVWQRYRTGAGEAEGQS